VQALRSLDKPPKSITVSEDGDRVVSMSIQVGRISLLLPLLLY